MIDRQTQGPGGAGFPHDDDDFEPLQAPADPGELPLDPPQAEPLCPNVNDQIALAIEIGASPALSAFIGKRFRQAAQGHTPAADLDRPPEAFARLLRDYAGDAADELRRGRWEFALRKIESLGALALAAHDRVRVEQRRAGEARE